MSDPSGDLQFDPGVSRHEWEARWEALQPDLADDPAAAFPELSALITEMADEFEFGDDPELEEGTRDLAEVHDVARRLDAGEDVSSEELEEALDAGRGLFRFLIDNRRTWGGVLGEEPSQPDS
jgi:hypothetical protein